MQQLGFYYERTCQTEYIRLLFFLIHNKDLSFFFQSSQAMANFAKVRCLPGGQSTFRDGPCVRCGVRGGDDSLGGS